MKRFLSLLTVLWLLSSSSVVCGETTWNLVTDASTLTVGDQIIIASSQKDYAMSTIQNTNNRGQAEIVKTDDQCTLTADVQIITLHKGTLPNTFALFVGDGYLYAASSTSNYLKTQTEVDANGSFVIDIDEDGVATMMAQGENTHNNLRYYSGLFSCYANTEGNVCLYKKTGIVNHTITYNENGTESQVQYAEGEVVTLKTPAEINGFSPVGWTLSQMTSAAAPPSDLTNLFTVTSDITFYAVYALENRCDFEKVNNPLDDYSGTYLIVNEDNNVAFDGSLENLDAAASIINVRINDDIVHSDLETDAATFTISEIENGYSIRSASGKYIGRTASSAGLNTSPTTVYVNTISIDENGDAVITASNSMVLRYNTSSNNRRFRYYPGSQQPIQLYRKSEDAYLCFCTSIDVISEPLTISENTVWENPTSLSNVVTVNDNALLTAHFLGNRNVENLIVENGSVDCNGGVFGTFLKNIGPSSEWGAENYATDGWYGISSPLVNVGTTSVSGLCVSGTNDYDLYSYSEKDAVWLNSKFEENAFSELETGNGYLYASKEGTTLQFSGEFNSNDIYENVSCLSDNQSLKGFNLLGNPFPKAITLGNVAGVKFSGFYLITDNGAWEAHVGNEDEIKPGEAFLVQTNSDSRICIKKEKASIRKNEEDQRFITVKVGSDEFEDVAYAFLCDENDEVMQMSKMPHNNAAIHSVSINNNAIAVFDMNVPEIPVSFKATKTGKYSISLNVNEKSKREISYLHLIDRFSGEDIDMLIEDGYEFIGSPRDNENRFIVKLNPDNNNYENDVFAFQNGNNLIVNGKGMLQIVDMLGRIVLAKDIDNESICVDNFKNGAYIVKLIGDEVKVQKIIVR
ncbi:MAG: InlB B-repeat-containing protein [Bacteroidales bacterium]|nr:InlB B-repeat-containing protein [Bacteroidales bacterium]